MKQSRLFAGAMTVLTICAGCSREPKKDNRPSTTTSFVGCVSAEQLARRYEQVVKNRDRSGYLELVHPSCIAAINDNNRFYFDDMFARDFETAIPPDTELKFHELDPTDSLPFGGLFDYPVKPELIFSFHYMKGVDFPVQRARQAMHDQSGRWWIVLPTPNAAALEQGRGVLEQEQQRKARVSEHLASMPGPLRAELTALVQKGLVLGAAKRFCEATGEEISVGLMIARELSPSPPGPGR